MFSNSIGIFSRNSAIVEKCINWQTVRWRRKPRWLPVAKSKMFYVPEKPKQDEDERRELLRLHNNYKTQMRSIRSYLHDEVVRWQETSSADNIIVTPEQEEAEFQRAVELNNKWNQETALIRNKRIEEENIKRQEYIRVRLELAKAREEEQREKIEELVRLEKEQAKTFITPDKLDSAIEYALANPVDYNFTIDSEWNIQRASDKKEGSSSESTPLESK